MSGEAAREGVGSESARAPLRLRAPAKVNLGLRTVGLRPDGYHLLESVFVPIDLADEVEVEIGPGRGALRVELSLEAAADAPPDAIAGLPDGPGNLAHRAASGFAERAGLACGIRIGLCKRIPTAAGLGGGSSDAAAVLRGLDRLLPGALPADELRALALSLGADVPFFLDPRPALVSGIGEQIELLDDIPGLFLVLANSGDSVATAEVYGLHDQAPGALTPVEPGSTMRAVSSLRAVAADPDEVDGAALASCLGVLLENDLEPAARQICPAVGLLKQQLIEMGALAAGMSGSGGTVFGVFSDAASSRKALSDGAFDGPVWARVAVSMGSR